MDQCTNNYECLVIDNTSSSNSLTDQVFWYKAEPQSDFKMQSGFLENQFSAEKNRER
jgi:hypothetical protein